MKSNKNRVLIINTFIHHKNKIGIEKILNNLNFEFKYGTVRDISEYNIIYSPSIPIDTSKYPDKKFIFGNNFSVFPDEKLKSINNIHDNSIYIQPSEWVVDFWNNLSASKYIKIKCFPFPVDTIKFHSNIKTREKIFIYFKNRDLKQLHFIEKYLNKLNITYQIFNYGKYNEHDYINVLNNAKYGIWIGSHESQGFALEEALSCNVPLLVWNTRYLSDMYDISLPKYECTTIPYWDSRCGEVFYSYNDFPDIFNKFLENINQYKPREYILENLSVKRCSERFNQLIKLI